MYIICSTSSVYVYLPASGSAWRACLLQPKADEWRLVLIGGLSYSDPLDHGKRGNCKRSPVAVTKPRTSHSRVITFIPRLRRDRSCGIHVGGKGAAGRHIHHPALWRPHSRSGPRLRYWDMRLFGSYSVKLWLCSGESEVSQQKTKRLLLRMRAAMKASLLLLFKSTVWSVSSLSEPKWPRQLLSIL